MNTKAITFICLFLRLALSVSFLSAVADRLGYWGLPGSPSVSWGNWENFVRYSNAVNGYVSPALGEVFAVVATVLEVLLALLLLIGYQLRLSALCSGLLLLLFALSMTVSFGIKPSLDYSVWTGAAASFLLSNMTPSFFSLDFYLANKK